jgi:hypothetical protein
MNSVKEELSIAKALDAMTLDAMIRCQLFRQLPMDLFAVLVEVEGTGVPLAYCFMEVFENDVKGERRAMPGATSGVLCQFLYNFVTR